MVQAVHAFPDTSKSPDRGISFTRVHPDEHLTPVQVVRLYGRPLSFHYDPLALVSQIRGIQADTISSGFEISVNEVQRAFEDRDRPEDERRYLLRQRCDVHPDASQKRYYSPNDNPKDPGMSFRIFCFLQVPQNACPQCRMGM